MKRCPKCGSGAERKNRGAGIFADVVGFTVGMFAGLFAGPAGGRATQKNVSSNICENAEYKCTNPKCSYEWIETRPT